MTVVVSTWCLLSCIRDDEAGHDILQDELSNFDRGDGGDDLSFYPFGKIINQDEKVLALTHGLTERAKYIHAPSGKW